MYIYICISFYIYYIILLYIIYIIYYIIIFIFNFIYIYLYIYLYLSIYIYIYLYIYKIKKERNVLRSFAKERNVLAFFPVLSHSLQKNGMFFTFFPVPVLISRQKLKKRTGKNRTFFKRAGKTGKFWTGKNEVPNPAFFAGLTQGSRIRISLRLSALFVTI